MEDLVKTYCWACGYECNDDGKCTRPYSAGGANCRESIYFELEE